MWHWAEMSTEFFPPRHFSPSSLSALVSSASSSLSRSEMFGQLFSFYWLRKHFTRFCSFIQEKKKKLILVFKNWIHGKEAIKFLHTNVVRKKSTNREKVKNPRPHNFPPSWLFHSLYCVFPTKKRHFASILATGNIVAEFLYLINFSISSLNIGALLLHRPVIV